MESVRKILVFAIIILLIGVTKPVLGNTNNSKSATYNHKQQVQRSVSEEEQCEVPDCVELGDILLMDVHHDESSTWKRPGVHNEHAALYIGGNYFVHAGMDLGGKLRRIIGGQVCVKHYSRFYSNVKNFAFVRVKTANQSQKQDAVDWAIHRQGRRYQFFLRFPWFGKKIADPEIFPKSWHPTANRWYCMELVWAAYYNQGIDIDSTEWNPDPPLNIPWVIGDDILADDDIEIIYRDVNNSIEIDKPQKSVYISNNKIFYTYNKTIVFGNIDIEVSIVNSDKINRVQFYIDNELKANDTNPPFNWTWVERSFGKKVIKVVAFETSEKEYSTNITVWKFF